MRYVDDSRAGIARHGSAKSFTYVSPRGKRVRDRATLARIKALAIPPAWRDVWICPLANGHLQATGRDARGRKQYRYHSRWREVRDETKYAKLLAFAAVLPRIRRRVRRDLAKPGLGFEKVIAAIVRLLEASLIRVGNEEYAKSNQSFGLTTMRDKHARVRNGTIQFRFRGKSAIRHEVDIHDPRLARLVRRCQELPGDELFQYVDADGKVRDVGSQDINDYLRSITHMDITAKDFRTWAGTVLAAEALKAFEEVDSAAAAKKNILRAIENVASSLGNTPAVCRKCYIHPEVLQAYLDGTLRETARQLSSAKLKHALAGLQPEEAAVLTLLERRLKNAPGARQTKHRQQRAKAG